MYHVKSLVLKTLAEAIAASKGTTPEALLAGAPFSWNEIQGSRTWYSWPELIDWLRSTALRTARVSGCKPPGNWVDVIT